MIDFENEIFDGVAKAVRAKFPNATVTSANLIAPAEFPAAMVFEASNVVDETMSDSGCIERGAFVAYDAYAYSNAKRGAKSQAKSVMAAIDDFMSAHNFTRTYSAQGPHESNGSIYQVYCRYVATVGENGKIYRRM